MSKLKLIFLLLLIFSKINCLKIDRVILATDNNPNYIQFWPIVSKAWKNIVGVKPTLALIADKSVKVDETLGDVIRFEPIPGVSTALYAQCIRLLLPAYFEEDGCILSDIDMVPLNKNYFLDSVKNVSDNCFITYRQWTIETAGNEEVKFPMCYNAAKGKVFKEVFKISDPKEIPKIIKSWSALNLGWNTDEIILCKSLFEWKDYTTRCVNLGHSVTDRIDRIGWGYNSDLLKKGNYVDMHCPRPYTKYKSFIDKVLSHIGLENQINKKHKFVIVTTSFNNEKWYLKNLDSIFGQNYTNYRVIYINDISTDKTGKLVQEYIRTRCLESKCAYIENQEKKYQVRNLYDAIHMCQDDEIIVTVDGDDWLPDDNVLTKLNKIYNENDIWMTYGQYQNSQGKIGGASPYSDYVIQTRSFRKDDWRATHLRTFKAFLFKKIKKEDLMYEEKFLDMAGDLAFMIPMLEMAGNRSMFIPEVLYVYNIDNPLMENKVNVARQNLLADITRNRKQYSVLSLNN